MPRNLSPADLNTQPLTAHADKATVKDWAATVRKYPGYREAKPAPRIFSAIMLSLLVLPLLGFWVVIIAGIATGAFNREAFTGAAVIVIAPALILVALLTFLALRGLANYFRGFGQWQRWYRMHQFADANGSTFTVLTDPSTMPGTVALGGYKVTRGDYFDVPTSPGFQYGTVTRHTLTQRIAGSQVWAFVEFRTPHPLPHMMLEVKGSKTRNYAFSSSQRVTLDSEFAKRFTLYVTEGSEPVALQLFTPEVLRLIAQTGSGFNIEVVEDRIVIHSVRLFRLERPRDQVRVFRLADGAGRALVKNAAAVEHDAPPSMLATEGGDGLLTGTPRNNGQMLRTRYSVSGTILGILVILTPIVMLVAGAFIDN